MQANKSVEKFSKKPKQVLDSHLQEPVLARGKKFNKPKRGGGVKGNFRNAHGDSILNQEKYFI